MNYCGLKDFDVANGPGCRVTIFVSGCPHHCQGCFQPETWDFDYGEAYTQETEDKIIEMLGKKHIKGLTLLGGEPMYPDNQQALLPLLKRAKETYPDKDIWCFTGYLFDRNIMGEMVEKYPFTMPFLKAIDVLVDGPFILAQKNLRLKFKGSENQRTIDMAKTLEAGQIILMDLK